VFVSELLKTSLGRLKVIGAIEAVSFLVLLLIAMPLKYMAGLPDAVRIIGGIHGGLWIIYIVALLIAWREERWSFGTLLAGGVASVLPFGPFVFDAKVLNASR
jgi:integral membrane protein